jgi:hypothetical protein
MKRLIYYSLILVLLLVPINASLAQGGVTAVDSLVIDFWPDYDQSAVLVLMTGALPEGTAVPATVTLPLPDDAQVNAVAYLDAVDGLLNTDYEVSGNQLTLTTPNLDFRVEYYLPYEANGSQRSFTFSWTSDMLVNQLEAKVQQPLAASGMVIEPNPIEVASASDGFTYHLLSDQIIPAGQPFSISVNYTMSADELSVNRIDNSGTIDLQPGSPAATSDTATQSINWPVVAGAAGGILVVAALGFLYLGNQNRSRVRKPSPRRRQAQPARSKVGGSKFCHNCGEAVDASDKFCRSCGTPVKGK